MKSSLNKLKRIALHKTVGKDKKDFQPSVKFDELALAAKVLTPLLFLTSPSIYIHFSIYMYIWLNSIYLMYY
jgi:hypothetical protein